ncbi:hypothetical protein [Haloechinothrix sp. LS1_15]|uniref:hypothetical protein n=1 Tax=Haloechinothrix sp. LS1_15 TaxID=2652248 RepID=UPI002944EB5F|nr:hypothetical protein [Haloechinothrix sp. LS1_15]MDV6012344.1 hypothetical protein [Haloechinothrix sp. LS1_15]
MSDFTVDIVGLEGLRNNLDRTVENIDSASKRLADAGSDTIGTDRLDKACGDFRSDWKDGLDLLREAVEEVGGALDAAITTYAELESSIEDNLRQMAAAMDSESTEAQQA